MANKSLFASLNSHFARADARNEAGGPAYTFEPKHTLAQLAATGCFNGTYYAEADQQLAAAILRRNPDSVVIPFDTSAYEARLDPSDSVLSLAERLAKFGGGGTNCSLPLAAANTRYHDRRFAGCVLVSDQESWVGAGRGGSTAVVTEWQEFVKNQMRLGGHGIPSPKLICIDLQPYATTQAPDRGDILNVGGFSDAVFNVVAAFLADDSGRFVAEVDSVEL